ncbi:MAG: PIN domain-containing protein [Candidatus Diapherotrites archaeon]|nr:PIN domain-containing protein [Candidatus Diapherotrites archaeon]
MTDYKLFLDSSIWVGYFMRAAELLGQMVDSHEGKVFTSALSFYEVPRKLHMLSRNEAFIKEAIRFMRENSTIIKVDEEIAGQSVEWAIKNKLAIADSIIYQSARSSESILITADNDFRGLSKVQVIII